MSKLHCMVDLETWGRGPTAQIISIGAVKFDPHDPFGPFDNFHVAVDPRVGPVQPPGSPPMFEVNPDTVMWWMAKDRTLAREHWLASQKLDLPTTIAGFLMWYGTESMPTWGNGATFDNVILVNAIERCGQERPWHFGHDRCFRTLKNLLPDVKGPTDEEMLTYLDPGALPGSQIPHTALYDAQWQAVWMRQILLRLRAMSAAHKTARNEAARSEAENRLRPPEGFEQMECPRRHEGPIPHQLLGVKDWWQKSPRGTRTCSFCGSIHPDEFMAYVEAGGKLGLSSKTYKVYVDADDRVHAKFYFQHLPIEQRKRFVEKLNDGSLNTGDYHFGDPATPDPFFVARARHPDTEPPPDVVEPETLRGVE